MPPKSKARSRSARSKSTDKKTPKSRSVSRSRSRARPKKALSETKRPRSRSRSREASPVKTPSRATTSSTKTATSTRSSRTSTKTEVTTRSSDPAKNPICKLMSSIPCIRLTPIGQYVCPILGLFLPMVAFYVNCMILTPAIGSGSANTIFGPSKAIGYAYIPTDIYRYFDWRVFLVMFVSITKISLISKYAKLGTKVAQVVGGKRHEYCNNLWLVIIAWMIPFWVLAYRPELLKPGFKVSTAIIESIPAIWTVLYMGVFADSFASIRHAYSRARGTKTFGKVIQDFYYGREVRPMWLGFDIKLIARRIGLCMLYLIISAMAHAQYLSHGGHVSPGLAFIFAIATVRILDYILFEHKQMPFFFYQYDPCGFRHLMEGYILFPFVYTLLATFCYTHPDVGKAPGAPCDTVHMGMAALVFMLGYYIDRASENQKYAFRTDPHHPRFAGMDVVPTTSGRKLLAGGWFRHIRFPSYLGGNLMTMAMAIPAGCAYPYVWLMPLFALIKTLCRIHQVEVHMHSKHGSAFSKYQAMVPKRLVPRIF